jgi:hypothetical protein
MDAARFATRFSSIIDSLCRAIAARTAEQRTRPDASKFLILLWTRLRRAAARFCALAAGAPKSRRRSMEREQKSRPRAPDLPHRRGWVLDPVPEASCSAGQLRDLLADPEAQTLIGSDPRFGRILRPLCRTLGLTPPPCLHLPKPAARKMRRKARRGAAKKPKWLASLVVSGPFHPPFQPPGTILQRRTRAPPRAV